MKPLQQQHTTRIATNSKTTSPATQQCATSPAENDVIISRRSLSKVG
jgi:hypothetical protein